jgi:hypothetical protein
MLSRKASKRDALRALPPPLAPELVGDVLHQRFPCGVVEVPVLV